MPLTSGSSDFQVMQVTSLCFHPEGSLLATGDEDGHILIWDVAEGKQVQSLEQHSEAIWSLAYSSGTGAVLASGGYTSQVFLFHFWRITKKEVVGRGFITLFVVASSDVFYPCIGVSRSGGHQSPPSCASSLSRGFQRSFFSQDRLVGA